MIRMEFFHFHYQLHYQNGARGHCLQQLFSSYLICSITIDNEKTVTVRHMIVTLIPLAVSFRKWSQRWLSISLTLSKQLEYVTAGYHGSLAAWFQNPWRGLPSWAYVNVNWLPSQMVIKWRWVQHSKQCKHLCWPCKTSISDKNGCSKSKEQKCRGIWGALLEERFCFPTQSLKQTIEGFSLSGKRLESAIWLFMRVLCSFLSSSSSIFSSLAVMIEFPGQNNPFFFNWKNLA